MTNDTQRPKIGTEEHREWVRKRAEERAKQIFANGPAEFDECGIISGSITSVTATDAELFPDEIEEYTPEERKPRLVPKK